MRCTFNISVSLLALLLAASSCSPQQKLQRRGGYLLVRNSVRIDNPSISEDEIKGFIQQKPTEGRFNLLKPGVWIYESTSRGKQTAWKKKFREKYGTMPVILDTTLALQSELSIRQYLKNKGYFRPAITYDFRYGRTIATATYKIITGKPMIIRNIGYSIPDPQLLAYCLQDTASSLLYKGMDFDTYRLDDERDRITQYLRNSGYYNFSKSLVTYIADTTYGNRDVALTLAVETPESADTLEHSIENNIFPRFFYRHIYVIPDVEQILSSAKSADTVTYLLNSSSTDSLEQFLHIIQGQKARLKPIALANAITFRPGESYSQTSVTQTYKRLIGMPIIRSANIGLSIPKEDADILLGKKWLDCTIKLTRNPVNLLSIGTEGTNSSGSLGMGFNALYQNRNIFRKAETFRFKLNTGAELQGNVQASGSERKLWIFNALEAGIETGIDFPRLLLPNSLHRNDRNYQAKTSFIAGLGYESRPDYTRNVTTFSASYHWSSSEKVKHTFTPLELNFVGIEKSSAFQAYLDNLTDPQFIGQYNDHLLTMVRYSIVFSNLASSKAMNPFFLRWNIETSGNTFHAMDRMGYRQPTPEGHFERFGIRYAQYARTDADFRKFWRYSPQKTLAYHLNIGFGIPYGNSDGIPFEKSFWLGGANDMRGWRLRSLGPGGYSNDSIRYDRTGDIMLFSSLEYRFPIYSFLKGGLFTDAGNIWLRKDNPDFPGGTFYFKGLFQHLAMNAGLGLRFDFSFFLFRLDWAFRMKNPQYSDQWFHPDDFRIRNAVWNFGIGYPF